MIEMDELHINYQELQYVERSNTLTRIQSTVQEHLTARQKKKFSALLEVFDFAKTGSVLATTAELGHVMGIESGKAKRDLELIFQRCGGKFEIKRHIGDISDLGSLVVNERGGRGKSLTYEITCTPVAKVYKKHCRV